MATLRVRQYTGEKFITLRMVALGEEDKLKLVGDRIEGSEINNVFSFDVEADTVYAYVYTEEESGAKRNKMYMVDSSSNLTHAFESKNLARQHIIDMNDKDNTPIITVTPEVLDITYQSMVDKVVKDASKKPSSSQVVLQRKLEVAENRLSKQVAENKELRAEAAELRREVLKLNNKLDRIRDYTKGQKKFREQTVTIMTEALDTNTYRLKQLDTLLLKVEDKINKELE